MARRKREAAWVQQEADRIARRYAQPLRDDSALYAQMAMPSPAGAGIEETPSGDAVANAGNVLSIQADTLANRPAFGTADRFYIATDTHQVFRDTGAAWVQEAETAGAVATHEAAGDPHPQYLTEAEGDAAYDALGAAAAAVAAHEGAGDPHPGYLTAAEGDAAYVANAGVTPSIQAGTDAGKPAFGTVGRLYVATDSLKVYRDTGTAWVQVAETAGAVATHEAAGNPHPTYLTQAEGDAAYAALGHNHDAAYAALVHASRHASAGADPIAPGDIGAATSGHNHDAAYAALGHNHDGVYAPATAPAGKLLRSSDLALDGSGFDTVAWNATDYLQGDVTSPTSTKLQAGSAGLYVATVNIVTTGSAGSLEVRLYINATTIPIDILQASVANGCISGAVDLELAVNDYIECLVYNYNSDVVVKAGSSMSLRKVSA